HSDLPALAQRGSGRVDRIFLRVCFRALGGNTIGLESMAAAAFPDHSPLQSAGPAVPGRLALQAVGSTGDLRCARSLAGNVRGKIPQTRLALRGAPTDRAI